MLDFKHITRSIRKIGVFRSLCQGDTQNWNSWAPVRKELLREFVSPFRSIARGKLSVWHDSCVQITQYLGFLRSNDNFRSAVDQACHNTKVAIKKMQNHFVGSKIARRALREFVLLSKQNHPNVSIKQCSGSFRIGICAKGNFELTNLLAVSLTYSSYRLSLTVCRVNLPLG